MPRRKTPEGKPMNATGQELKTVRLELPKDLHKRLRREAAERDMSMAALARLLVDEGLSRKKSKSES